MFRFTIRDVLWLTVVVALGVGWWVSHRTARAQRYTVIAHAERLQDALWKAKRAYVECKECLDLSMQIPNYGKVFALTKEPEWAILDEPIPGTSSSESE